MTTKEKRKLPRMCGKCDGEGRPLHTCPDVEASDWHFYCACCTACEQKCAEFAAMKFGRIN